MTETKTIPDLLTYAGRRMSGTKALYAYVHADEPQRELYFGKPLKRGVPVGMQFNVERSLEAADEGRFTVIGGGGSSIGQIDDEQQIARWSAEDKATAVMLAKITNDRRVAREANDPIESALAVLADAYRAQRTIAGRAAFADYVTAAIAGAQ